MEVMSDVSNGFEIGIVRGDTGSVEDGMLVESTSYLGSTIVVYKKKVRKIRGKKITWVKVQIDGRIFDSLNEQIIFRRSPNCICSMYWSTVSMIKRIGGVSL